MLHGPTSREALRCPSDRENKRSPRRRKTNNLLLPRTCRLDALTTLPILPLAMQKKLLVVDDDIVALKATSRILQASGYDVTSTTRTDEALHFLERDKFKGVVCDYHMPDQNGTVIVTAVQRHHPETKVLLITGYREDLPEYLKSGKHAVRIVDKPFTLQGLLQAVHEEIGIPVAAAAAPAPVTTEKKA
jgi:DNA-binding NtrC family response regulator